MTKRKRHSNSPKRPIPAAAMRAWREEMGLSERDAAARLGMSKVALRTAEREGGTLYIGLACAALHHKLPPWGFKKNGFAKKYEN